HPGNDVIEGAQPALKATPEIIRSQPPAGGPQGGAQGIEQQEARPGHAHGAGHHTVALPEHVNEPANGDNPGAVTIKMLVQLAEPVPVQPDNPAIAQDQPPPAAPTQ